MNIIDLACSLCLPVFPCRADKTPACKHGFKDAKVDAAEIKTLWCDYPGPLIGVPTGKPSGLFVLDIDSIKHPEAGKWLEQHKDQLPATREHRSQSGGRHLVFEQRNGLRNSQGKLCRGVDTRGDGGYFIWWPAHAPQAQQKLDLPIAEVPDWLYQNLIEPPPPNYPARPLSHIAAAPLRVRGILRFAAAAREGERNAALFWCANRLHDMAAWGEIDRACFAEACQQLEQLAISIGLPQREAARTIASAMKVRS